MVYTKQNCVDAVRDAASNLGQSPTYKEYEKFAKGKDDFASAATIKNRFGWDEVKSGAGLVSHANNDETFEKPDVVDMSQDGWHNLAPSEQKRLRNKAYIARHKVERGCSECGYDDSFQALDAHHIEPDEKSAALSKMSRARISEIDEELSKCEILCANCHRQKSFSYLSCQ